MYPLTRRIVTATFALLTAFLIHASGATLPQDDIVVSEGTAVKVITTSEITSKKAKPNDPVVSPSMKTLSSMVRLWSVKEPKQPAAWSTLKRAGTWASQENLPFRLSQPKPLTASH
jgi:hypothetical protein